MAYYLRTLGGRPELWDDEKLVFKQLQPLLLVAYLERKGEQNRLAIANAFWPELDKENRLGRLSEVLRVLSLDAPQAIIKSIDNERISTDVRSDIKDLMHSIEQEDYELSIELYKDHYLKNVEHNKRLKLDDSPDIYDWLMAEREGLVDTMRDALLNYAELKAAQDDNQEAAKLAQQALNTRTEQSFLIPKDYQRIHTLLKASNHPRAIQVEREIIKLYENKELTLSQTPTEAKAKLKTPSNLPSTPSPLFGRKAELEECTAILKDTQSRLLTITGPAGIGKTHFTTELARKLKGYQPFKDGIYLVLLEQSTNQEELLQEINKALKLTPIGTKEPLDAIKHHLPDKNLLLVLDNFEQLIHETKILDELLKHCPNLKLIVTSRAHIPSDWANQYSLAGLKYPTQTYNLTLSDALSYPAIQFFLSEAQKANKTFTLNNDNLNEVLNLMQHTDAMPLALKLSASWLNTIPLTKLNEELKQNLTLLDTQEPNQRSVTNALETSYQRLSQEEQQAFNKLAIFAGEFSLEAAQEITNINLTQLRTLQKRSLINTTETNTYQFHPLINQYAQQKLSQNPAVNKSLIEKHANYYLNQIQKRRTGTPEEKNNIYKKLGNQFNNISQAWQNQEKQDPTQLPQYAHALRLFCQEAAHIPQCLNLLNQTQERLQKQSIQSPEISSSQAWLNNVVGDHLKALGQANLVLAYNNHSSKSALLNSEVALNTLGSLYSETGYYEKARESFLKIIDLFESLEVQKSTLLNLVVVSIYLGEYTDAEEYLTEAERYYSSNATVDRITLIQLLKGRLFIEQKKNLEAKNILSEALLKARQHNLLFMIPRLEFYYACSLQGLGEIKESNEIFDQVFKQVTTDRRFLLAMDVGFELVKNALIKSEIEIAKMRLCSTLKLLSVNPHETRGLTGIITAMNYFKKVNKTADYQNLTRILQAHWPRLKSSDRKYLEEPAGQYSKEDYIIDEEIKKIRHTLCTSDLHASVY